MTRTEVDLSTGETRTDLPSDPQPGVATVNAVRAEAERRIKRGLTIAGNGQFRLKDQYVSRLQGMLTLAEALEDATPPEAVSITIRTEDGRPVTFTSSAQIAALNKAASVYIADVLAASSSLQGLLPADYQNDRHWPAVPVITL